MADVVDGVACTHACSFGCGRTYDVVFTQVVDGSTLFLCIPDLVNFIANLAKSMTEPDDPEVKEIVASTTLDDVMLVTDGTSGYGIRGHSDPHADDDFTFDGEVSE